MADEWKSMKLAEASVLLSRGVTPSYTELGGMRVLNQKCVREQTVVYAAARRTDTQKKTVPEEKLLRTHDILVNSTGEGTLGRVAQVKTVLEPTTVDSHVTILRPNPMMVDPLFLGCLVRALQPTIERMAEGSTGQTELSRARLGELGIELPPRAEQAAIAAVLGALDDKIELNRRMNATLEAMARALFQSWFVNFDPVRAKLDGRQSTGMDKATAALLPDRFEDSALGQIPAGWVISEVGDIADVIDCLHGKKPERQATGNLYLQLNNIRGDGLIDISDAFSISEADYLLWTSRMEAVDGDCVITNVGRVGAVGQMPAGVKAALGRNMTGIRCKAKFLFPSFLVECLISDSMREEIGLKTDSGTILDALNVKNIPKLRFVRPTNEVATHFEDVIRPLRRLMEQNLVASRTLANLRDTLLPKLLSGELSVAGVQS